MRDSENQMVLVEDKETISESLGITPQRRLEMQKRIDEICNTEFEKEGPKHQNVIKAVYDEFENPNECAFALYILDHENESVAINELFDLPEVVAEVKS